MGVNSFGSYFSMWDTSRAAVLDIRCEASSSITANDANSYIAFSGQFSYIQMTAFGSFANFYEFRQNGVTKIDGNGLYRHSTWFSENLNLGTLVAARWFPAYDSNGSYLGKVPIIP